MNKSKKKPEKNKTKNLPNTVQLNPRYMYKTYEMIRTF